MAVIGHGIDIVEVARIEKLLADTEEDFLEGAFSKLEQQLAPSSHARTEYFAGRFAAKEAVLKALGTGFSEGIALGEVEIARRESGAATVSGQSCSGRLREPRSSKLHRALAPRQRPAHVGEVVEASSKLIWGQAMPAHRAAI
jgi:phosphopantetheine--protein transferase-like protein